MDEILIDEKKYVSSKRAAKVTGYAKDYIGQLCREGRVPARLVGRSWYVLESAIHDHRFGTPKVEHKEKSPVVEADSHLKLQSTWESPRYEATTPEILPSINRLRNTDYKAPITQELSPEEVSTESAEAQSGFQDTQNEPVEEKKSEPLAQGTPNNEAVEHTPFTVEDGEVNIPVHTLYELPPESLLPNHPQKQVRAEVQPEPIREPQRSRGFDIVRVALTILKALSVVVALLVALVAAVSTGYFDKLIASHNRATQITGIGTYIK